MWDLQITNEISLIKNKKINILQIGFFNNEYSIWLLNNIMLNNNSKLYILNPWYQNEKNQNMINQQSTHNFLKKKEDEDKFFFKDLKSFSNKIINIKKKTEEMFRFFNEEKINFELILIDLKFLNFILTYLIYSIELLSKSGILVLINTNSVNNNIIETFINTFQKNIKVIRFNNIILFKHNLEEINKLDIPLYIEHVFNKYLSFKEYNIKNSVPKIKLKKILWNFELNDNFFYSNEKLFEYNYEIEKYNDYIYDFKNSKYDKLKKIDVNYLMIYRPKNLKYYSENSNKYNQQKLEKIKKILNMDKYFKFDKTLLKSNIRLGEKKVVLFTLSSMDTNSEYFKYNLKYKNFYEKYLSTIKKKIGKNTELIKTNNTNLLDFNNIYYLSNKNKSSYDIIQIFLNRYIIFNTKIIFYKYYQNILLLNLLFLILSIQKNNGNLIFFLPPLTNKVQIQFLQIISNYYNNVSLDTYFNYSNYYSIVINASGFKGISKEELNNFYNSYYPFYEQNIYPHINDMFLGKKIEGLYLDNIISNKIDKKLIKVVRDFNKKYYKEFLENLKIKIDIYDFLNNSSTPKAQKDYIYDKLFQTQYKRFIEESRKMYGKKIKD